MGIAMTLTTQSEPQVVMLSLWRNDEFRDIAGRIAHLLGKSYSNLRWLWIVGDSSDDTATILQQAAKGNRCIQVLKHDTGLLGDEPRQRLVRLAATVEYAFVYGVNKLDDYVLIHESDLRSSVDLVEQLLATKYCPVAGWPVLGNVFYDTWAYRANGKRFTNHSPYHEVYRPDAPFEVDSFGSVYMCHADDVRNGLRATPYACLTVCEQLRKRFGRRLFVDPRIVVEQPTSLWTPAIGAPV